MKELTKDNPSLNHSRQHTQQMHAVRTDGHRTEEERFEGLLVVLGLAFLGVRLVLLLVCC